MANNRFVMRLRAFSQYNAAKYGSDHYWINFDRSDYCICQEIGMEYVQKITDQERKKKWKR